MNYAAISADSFEVLFRRVLTEVLNSGSEVNPRGMATKEILGLNMILTNPRDCLIFHPQRRLNLYLILGEWVWFLSGSDNLKAVSYYNKFWEKCSDDGETLNGAYGKRIFAAGRHNGINQFVAIQHELERDPYSRRAVLHIHEPRDLLRHRSKDIPCNSLMQFMIRDGKVQAFVYCRSNDAIKGLCNDIAHFCLFQMLMADCLGLPVGHFHYYVASQHIYENDYEFAKKFASTEEAETDEFPRLFDKSCATLQDFIEIITSRAAALRIGSSAASVNIARSLEHDDNDFVRGASAAFYALHCAKKKDYRVINDMLNKYGRQIPEPFYYFIHRTASIEKIR